MDGKKIFLWLYPILAILFLILAYYWSSSTNVQPITYSLDVPGIDPHVGPIAFDENGQAWIGTSGFGAPGSLRVFDGKNWKTTYTTENYRPSC